MALAMEFDFLLDRERMLLSIGYLVREGTLDPNCYDLLASEARLASFIAIAKGDVPARHWFRLGRSVTPVAHGAALISWSGSMFEYLMPSLVMRAPAGSLLEQTSRLIVRRQIDYGGDAASALGHFGVRLQCARPRVHLSVFEFRRARPRPEARAWRKPRDRALCDRAGDDGRSARRRRPIWRGSQQQGARGRYGFYEALDYTPIRVPEGESVAIVRAFMAHHQGMTIVAIANALFDGVMRARFHAEPIVQATELLLQERTPRDVAVARPWADGGEVGRQGPRRRAAGGRRFTSAHQATPATHLLSNGRYAMMLTTAGSGYSRWGDIAVTRWREDATRDDFGSYVFLQGRPQRAGLVGRLSAERRRARRLRCRLQRRSRRVRAPRRNADDDTGCARLRRRMMREVRRVSISNTGSRVRELDVTSYAELVLARHVDDVAHPAFSKLFVETEYLADVGAILATRRRRSPSEPEIWAAHLAVVDGEAVGKPEIETDRARFLGRGQGIRTPIALIDGRPLSNTVGTVLDPIFALRRRVRRRAGRNGAHRLLDDGRVDARSAARLRRQAPGRGRLSGARRRSPGRRRRCSSIISASRPAKPPCSSVSPDMSIYAAPTLRPSSDAIVRGAGAQSGLWAHGISGDLPIVLLRITDTENIDIARELLQAHEYWRMKQLAVDLVILNERQSSYVQDLQIAIETLVRTSQSRRGPGDGPAGRVFVLRADLIAAETRALLASVARIVLVAQRGSLFDQLDRIADAKPPARPLPPRAAAVSRARPRRRRCRSSSSSTDSAASPTDGREYVTILRPGQSTPAPWINVIANPSFGFQVAAEGGGYTWSVNSRENQLTPWSNDPGHRSSGRGVLSARRRHRRAVETDRPSHPRRGRHLCRPPRPRLQPVRAFIARNRGRPAAVRADCPPRSRFRASRCAT